MAALTPWPRPQPPTPPRHEGVMVRKWRKSGLIKAKDDEINDDSGRIKFMASSLRGVRLPRIGLPGRPGRRWYVPMISVGDRVTFVVDYDYSRDRFGAPRAIDIMHAQSSPGRYNGVIDDHRGTYGFITADDDRVGRIFFMPTELQPVPLNFSWGDRVTFLVGEHASGDNIGQPLAIDIRHASPGYDLSAATEFGNEWVARKELNKTDYQEGLAWLGVDAPGAVFPPAPTASDEHRALLYKAALAGHLLRRGPELRISALGKVFGQPKTYGIDLTFFEFLAAHRDLFKVTGDLGEEASVSLVE